MAMKKKHVGIAIPVIIVAVLALPIINLIQGQRVPEEFAAIKCGSVEMTAAKEVIGNKCLLCHTQDPELPFYAPLPVVGSQIKRDIIDGEDKINFISFYKNGGDDQALMSKLEHTIQVNNMPPVKFLIVHWDTALNTGDKNTILKSIAKARSEKHATGLAADQFKNDAVQPLLEKWREELSPAKVAFGKRLFNDKRLSDDNTISCASCHELDKGGTDQAQVSTGVRDQLGPINAPTVFNSAHNIMQFWDGRAADLAEQADGPPLDPLEMASNWKQIIGKLKKDAELTAIHTDIYKATEWTDHNIRDAIAEYEKTLLTPDSDLDKYLKGDADAISAAAAQGYELFKSHSCATCHTGAAMGGQSFEKPIDPVAYYASRDKDPVEKDFGRFNVTKQERDRFKMKVPLLRNIALTHPYMHDGFTSDLAEVVTIMNDHFVTPSNRKRLSSEDTDKIVAMLNANTGKIPL